MTDRIDTLVVGAGIAGLAYAHARGPDADLLVVDAGDRVGGLIRTGHQQKGPHGDLHWEWGPEALQGDAPETSALLDELGLELVPAPAAAAQRIVLDARRRPVQIPSGPGAFLRSPLLGAAAKLRALSEPFRARDRALEGSVADFVRHRLGPQVLERLVDPAVSGIYAGDPERLSLRAAFPMLYTLVKEHGSILRGLGARAKARRAAGEPRRGPPTLASARGGLQAIPDALAASLGDRLRLGWPAECVRREGGSWHVEGPGGAWACERLVLAVPAAVAARVLEQAEPALSQELGGMVSEAVVSVAHVWPRDRVRHPLDAFGYLVPSGLGMMHLGTLFSSSIQPDRCPGDRVLLRTLLGGTRHPDLVDRDDAALLDLVVEEVGPVLGLEGRPAWSHVARWRAALPRYDLDQVRRQATIDALLAERPGLSIVGNHRRGISVNALIEASRTLAREHGPSSRPPPERESSPAGAQARSRCGSSREQQPR